MQSNPKAKIIEKGDLMKFKLIQRLAISQKPETHSCKLGLEDLMIACGYNNGRVKIFNINTTNVISQMNTNKGVFQTPVNCIKWRPFNSESNIIGSALLAANTDGNIYQYAAKTGKQIAHIREQSNYIMTIDYAPDGLQFGSAGKDNVIRVYDQATKILITELKSVEWDKKGHSNRIFCLKFKPDDPNLLASGGWDQNINIWDIRDAKACATINGPKIGGESIDFRDNLILSGANRGVDQLQLWDWRKQALVSNFRWDLEKQQTNAFLFGCQFVKSERDLVVAVGANQMKIFSLMDASQIIEVLFEKDESLYAVDTSASTGKIVCAGKKGTAVVLSLSKTLE